MPEKVCIVSTVRAPLKQTFSFIKLSPKYRHRRVAPIFLTTPRTTPFQSSRAQSGFALKSATKLIGRRAAYLALHGLKSGKKST